MTDQSDTTAWQPIETAPKAYGTAPLLFWDGVDYQIGWWAVSLKPYRFEGWTTGWETAGGYDVGYNQINPTHWQPLPSPPERITT